MSVIVIGIVLHEYNDDPYIIKYLTHLKSNDDASLEKVGSFLEFMKIKV